ncbi:MAG: lipid-A-disaccharide synthase-related protein [Candidatus Sericytochromatia bacterium]
MTAERGREAKQILFLSNGSGEDKIASVLAQFWQQTRPQDSLVALALVGHGDFYTSAGISLLSPGFAPPSAGFAYLHPLKLLKDFRAGLGGHLAQTWRRLKSTPADAVIAVGDIVAVAMAWRSGRPFAFVGCALSDYYTAGQHHTYDPLQRLGLKQAHLGIFPRDQLTAQALQSRGLPALCLGNPMLDALEYDANWQYSPLSGRYIVAVAPGSHADALVNFRLILAQLSECWELPVDYLCALAPGKEKQAFEQVLATTGWQKKGERNQAFWQRSAAEIRLIEGAWGSILAQSQILIGLAGTANEQAAGLGIPIVSFSGQGLQYSSRFAEAQTRLLGPALHWLEPCHPAILAHTLKRLLCDKLVSELAQKQAQAVSHERFGPVGAAGRIVAEIQRRL